MAQSSFSRSTLIHLGATGAAHSCQDLTITHVPPGVLISRHDCTVVIKEGAAPAIGAASRKSWRRFLEHLRVSFKTARCWTCPNGCSPLPTNDRNSGAFLLRARCDANGTKQTHRDDLLFWSAFGDGYISLNDSEYPTLHRPFSDAVMMVCQQKVDERHTKNCASPFSICFL